MTNRVKIDGSHEATVHHPEQPVSSGLRGRPVTELLKGIEARNPGLVASRGLSSAAMAAANLVRGMRKSRGMTQQRLADEIGVTQARISEIESGGGRQGPTFELLVRIADACGMRIVTEASPVPAAKSYVAAARSDAVAV